jgi:hypothetical protein
MKTTRIFIKPPRPKILAPKLFANKFSFYIYELNIGQKSKSDGESKEGVGFTIANNGYHKVCHPQIRLLF